MFCALNRTMPEKKTAADLLETKNCFLFFKCIKRKSCDKEKKHLENFMDSNHNFKDLFCQVQNMLSEQDVLDEKLKNIEETQQENTYLLNNLKARITQTEHRLKQIEISLQK